MERLHNVLQTLSSCWLHAMQMSLCCRRSAGCCQPRKFAEFVYSFSCPWMPPGYVVCAILRSCASLGSALQERERNERHHVRCRGAQPKVGGGSPGAPPSQLKKCELWKRLCTNSGPLAAFHRISVTAILCFFLLKPVWNGYSA